jgi:tetratricopeptide (TPR) repeat protein
VQAMQLALRSDRELVGALLKEARAELIRDKRRELRTWTFLAALAWRTRQLDTAESLFRQCLLNLPTEKEFDVYSGLLQVLWFQRKHEEIIRLCRDSLRRRGDRLDMERLLRPQLAASLAALGRYDEAIEQADLAVKLGSDNYQVVQRCRKSEILAAAGRYAEAVELCEQTLKKFTGAAQVMTVRQSLSNVYSLKGDHARSEEQLRLVLEMDPDQALANNNLGYQMADRNANLEEAERLIRRAIELERSARKQAEEDGDNAAYLDSLGWVLFRRGKPAEAREWLDKAAALPDGVDDPAVWDHLGDVLAKLDQPAKAKEAWQKAVKLYESGGRRQSDSRKAEVEKKLKTVD